MAEISEKTLLLSHGSVTKKNLLLEKSNYYIEPVVFLLTFAWRLGINFVPNLLLKQTCLHRGYNETHCSNLNIDEDTKKIEEIIQPEVAQILMVIGINSSFIPGIVSLFLLPWSDKYGRKKVICTSIFGHAASLGLLALIATLTDHNEAVSPWTYVFSGLPIALTGEARIFRMVTLCYVTDSTDKASRSPRFFLIEILTFAGMLLAFIVTSSSFLITSPSVVIGFCFTVTGIAFIYAVLVLPRDLREIDRSMLELARSFFSLDSIVEVFKTCTQPRPSKDRKILWILLILMALFYFKENGTVTVFYLFLRQKFSMTLQEFSVFLAAAAVTAIIGCSVGLFTLKKIFALQDTSLAVVGLLTSFVESLMFVTASSTNILYLTILVCSLKSITLVIYQSMISSHVPNDEIGKVFSFTNFIESISTLVGSTVYTFVYSNTLLIFPGAFYFVSMGCSIFSLALIVKIIRNT